MNPDRLQPALYGGLFIGVLSALPFVGAGNCCCCLWVIAGGMLAAYLRQQNSPFAITTGEAALVGLMAGVIGGLAWFLISIPVEMMMGPFQKQMMERFMSSQQDLPPETRVMLERFGSGQTMLVFKFVSNLVCGTIFGLLGGLLGVAVFKKNVPPPPGTIQVLPPEG